MCGTVAKGLPNPTAFGREKTEGAEKTRVTDFTTFCVATSQTTKGMLYSVHASVLT